MSRALLARLKRIEDERIIPEMVIVNPRRFPGTPELQGAELEAHREVVRSVCMNPKGIVICYDQGGIDPLADLLGAEDPAYIHHRRTSRKIDMTRIPR